MQIFFFVMAKYQLANEHRKLIQTPNIQFTKYN